jgi:cytochrome c peroxidase
MTLFRHRNGGGSVHEMSTEAPQRGRRRLRSTALAAILTVGAAAVASALVGVGWAGADSNRGLAPLDSVAVPEPADLASYVVDRQAATELGKAFFWDEQVGSDGATACATCHFNAGADSRSKGQLSPGINKGATFDKFGPNAQVSIDDFPFHKLADPNNPAAGVLSDTHDVMGSQSIVNEKFVKIVPGSAVDAGTTVADPTFAVGGVDVRQVTPRNAPTVINAAFDSRLQWDGKAQNDFNGIDPFGARNKGARILEATGPGQISPVQIDLQNAALASQAVGPVTNATIMSFNGRTFPDVGKKLTSLRPLGEQSVSSSDSLLGSFATPGGKGLSVSYADLIQKAFAPQFWSSNLIVRVNPDKSLSFVPAHEGPLAANEYTLLQANFSLFWGLAVQLYESTLVSDQSPVDRFLAGDNTALTKQEQDGMSVFTGKGHCSTCHGGPELTNAATSAVQASPTTTMSLDHGTNVTFDTGFANIGVRPTGDDIGEGGVDKFGIPFSLVRAARPDAKTADPLEADGMFKIPTLRNVALTAPYFHNGGAATLRQVVDFYSRGGDFANPNQNPEIQPLNLSESDKQALVAFLQALTDPRVPAQAAPFDHPELVIPNGHPGDSTSVVTTAPGVAAQDYLDLPAVGAGGAQAVQPFPNFPFVAGLLQPFPGFQPLSAPAPAAAPAAPAPAPAATAPAPATAPPPPAAAAAPAAITVTPVAAPKATPLQRRATRSIVLVSARLTLHRAGSIAVRAEATKTARRLSLLAGSRVGKTVARASTTELHARIAHAGVVRLQLRLLRTQLRSGNRYQLVVRMHAATTRIGLRIP